MGHPSPTPKTSPSRPSPAKPPCEAALRSLSRVLAILPRPVGGARRPLWTRRPKALDASRPRRQARHHARRGPAAIPRREDVKMVPWPLPDGLQRPLATPLLRSPKASFPLQKLDSFRITKMYRIFVILHGQFVLGQGRPARRMLWRPATCGWRGRRERATTPGMSRTRHELCVYGPCKGLSAPEWAIVRCWRAPRRRKHRAGVAPLGVQRRIRALGTRTQCEARSTPQ